MSNFVAHDPNLTVGDFRVVIWVETGVAILFVLTRGLLRLHSRERPSFDDAFVVFALLCMVISSALYTPVLPAVFLLSDLEKGRVKQPPAKFMAEERRYLKYQFAIIILFWTTIWMVKGSFLAFYKQIFSGQFIGWQRAACLYYATAADIFTDLLIMALPLSILWQLRMNKKTKMALGLLFLVGFVIILFAILRLVYTRPKHAHVNPKWLAVWSSTESCIAVGVSCAPPFRKFLVRRGQQQSASAKVSGPRSAENSKRTSKDRASGRSTPVANDAPPSAHATSSARKALRAQQKKRLFPTVDYEARYSHFDPRSDYRDFRGFFVLFWIGLAIMVISTMLRNVRETGYPFVFKQRHLFLENLWEMGASDFFMTASTMLSLPLHRLYAQSHGVLRFSRGGVWIQAAFQAMWLSYWVQWPFLRRWTWTAQVFFTLHLMALFMKMHSYAFYNGHLSETKRRLNHLDKPAKDANTAAAVKYPTTSGHVHELKADGDESEEPFAPREERIRQLREDLAVELTSPLGNVTYDQNLTVANFVDFLLCPTLCYELEFPRTEKRNYMELFYKTSATFGCIFLLTITSENFIIPVLDESAVRLQERHSLADGALIMAETTSKLLFPFMITFLLVFLVIFEYICGAFAEITCFADRHFYDDWWNSCDWLEFSREWNVPVHNFFRRHVYAALSTPRSVLLTSPLSPGPQTTSKWEQQQKAKAPVSRPVATFITFLISALAHELIMGCITKKLRGYGFFAMMLQMPIVLVQRSRWIRGRTLLNNILFWCSMVLGLSMMCALYVLAPAVYHQAANGGTVRRNYQETADRARGFAYYLKKHGYKRVGILCTNTPAFLEAIFAIAAASGVNAAINYRLKPDDLTYIFEHAEVDSILVDAEFLPLLDQFRSRNPRVKLIVDTDLDCDDGDYDAAVQEGLRYDQEHGSHGWEGLERQASDEEATLALSYTSGTTARPKGVEYTHRGAYLAALGNVVESGLNFHEGRCRYLWTLPMFHAMGWTFPWAVTAVRGTHYCLRKVDYPLIWKLLKEEGCTHFNAAPTVNTLLCNSPEAERLPHKVRVTVAASPPTGHLFEQMAGLNLHAVHVYGLTETYGPITKGYHMPAWEQLPASEKYAKLARQGHGFVTSLPARVVKTGDRDDQVIDVAKDGKEVGDIVFTGNICAKGYFKDPEATRKLFAGGVLHTGDLAVWHSDGAVQIIDRGKDIIISGMIHQTRDYVLALIKCLGGENISSLALESVIVTHPDILECGVVAVKDEKWGERPQAFVTIKEGKTLRGEDLIQWMKDNPKVSGFMVPKGAEVIAELPKTSTGKVRKNVLREWAQGAERDQAKLLETGSTALIRNTAAQQLADIQKKHPEEVFNLLTRVVPYLRVKGPRSWETRTAAAKAVGGIVEHAERFDPNSDESESGSAAVKLEDGPPKKEEDQVKVEVSPPASDQLQLETLDVQSIMENGKPLLASDGKSYDLKLAKMEPGQRLEFQKKSLTARLGLGGEYTDDSLLDDADIEQQVRGSTPGAPPALSKLNTQVDRKDNSTDAGVTPTAKTPTVDGGATSKRMQSYLKRKRKLEAKQAANKVQILDLDSRRKSTQINATADASKPTVVKKESMADEDDIDPPKGGDYFSLDRKGEDDSSKLVSEFKGPVAPIKSELQPDADEEGVEWPFERLCEYLMVDMFDHNWEVRHGAALGLREILRVHAAGAGRERGKSKSVNAAANQRWLNDLACRICAVFMLDRFADFGSDNAVTPVRETAGQALGSLLQDASAATVEATYHVLRSLVLQEHLVKSRVWQACHGGMIGLRYLVAVRYDVLLARQDLMDSALSVVMHGLSDNDDDVRAVSSATLIPVCEEFVKRRPASLGDLVHIVWECLGNLNDDLSSSTGAVMDLLSKLCSFSQVLDVMKANASSTSAASFGVLVPRLFPFLRHTIRSVRAAALRALRQFLDIKGEGTTDWVNGKALRLIFQNLIVERDDEVRRLSLDVWMALLDVMTTQRGFVELEKEMLEHLSSITTVTMHPIGVSQHPLPMSPSLFMRPSGHGTVIPAHSSTKSPPRIDGEPPAKKQRRRSNKTEKESTPPPPSPHNLDGPVISGDVDLVGFETFVHSKLAAVQAFAKLISLWPDNSLDKHFASALVVNMTSRYSTSREIACSIIGEAALLRGPNDAFLMSFIAKLESIVKEEPPKWYTDIKSSLYAVRGQCHNLMSIFKDSNIRASLPNIPPMVQGDDNAGPHAFDIQDGERIAEHDFEKLKSKMGKWAWVPIESKANGDRQELRRVLDDAKALKEQRDIRVKSSAAAALIALQIITKPPTGVIQGVMNSVRHEENFDLQKRSAASVVALVRLLVSQDRRAIVKKVGSNLASFYTNEIAETPEFLPNVDVEDIILSLRKDEDIQDHADPAQHERQAKQARICRRGAKETFEVLASTFGRELFEYVPTLKALIEEPLQQVFANEISDAIREEGSPLGQRAIDAMSLIRALIVRLDPSLYGFVLDLAPLMIKALKCKYAVFRYMAAKSIATICSVIRVEGFELLVKQILPCINNPLDLHQRQGAVECVYHLISVMGDHILPYVIFLIVPILGRMSDSDDNTRLIATTTFATLVKLVPLEAGVPDPPGLSADLLEGRERERKFMSQMLDPKKIEDFEVPVAIKATLRSYQQDGINWLNFLNRYNLHGVLCDDMGLGKTLQTICMVASDHHMRADRFAQTQDPDSRRLPSLIVCPSSLSGHWQQEIQQFAPFLTSAAYVGNPTDRAAIRHSLHTADIIITSYEVCRSDIEVLAPLNWNYCVLDEGHLIKNPSTKITLSVKRLNSYHRLILSGTPIQNNVLELWSLFDFLMPGFLGTEKIFKDRFAKPIALSRFGKSSSKEQEAGALALEALHKQVLPFLMRRLKEEVLNDLPPKTIQNYYCDLSELQRKLFDDFNKKEGAKLKNLAGQGDKEAKSHIFTCLQYMRKLCNSPSLVMTPKHVHYATTQQYLKSHHTSLDDPIHAPKLAALRDLLVDCGIGSTPSDPSASSTTATSQDQIVPSADAAVAPHRALIFCQATSMLDLVSSYLKSHLPSATSLTLNGAVPAAQRQSLVNTFNSDPSIDLLLMTTAVGGLGLNLTGADTVIFVEHDWNPQKDIQAMDRAHRIGQRRAVNVYRLVTRGTLEEKILNLQRFKIDVASSVVKQQKAGLAGMDTGEILDLFNLEGVGGVEEREKAGKEREEGASAVDEVTGEVREKGKKGFLDDIGELWSEEQYEEEFDMEGFLGRMKG
ncbi:MAG: hypothetical protein Q9159_004847 [Coniocarpon cinnabarinum]